MDYTPGQEGWAVFLPAVSTFYNNYIAKQISQRNYVEESRLPEKFEHGVDGLNFLKAKNTYFHYKYALYSAGHAELDLKKSAISDRMIRDRDKGTIVLGDSGGYQIGKGVINFDWESFYVQDGKADKVRTQILKWLEETADWSMILDVPVWACDPPNNKRTKLNSFDDCLDATVYNNAFFSNKRTGKTKFLNVLQGRDWEECVKWYDTVKQFSEFEGWAMGGANMCNMRIALKRLIKMRDDGLLEGKDWIHFLGTAQLDWAVYLTMIQREIRKTVNPNLTISFDCASPFIATANGLIYTDPVFSAKGLSIAMDSARELGYDNKNLKGSKVPFAYRSPIGDRLTEGDICWYGHGDKNKIGKEGKTSWDSFSYQLIMAHNVCTHIEAVQKVNRLAHVETARHQVDWKDWVTVKGRDKRDEFSLKTPRNLIYFNYFVEELFKSENPYDMIDKVSALDTLTNARWRASKAKSKFLVGGWDPGQIAIDMLEGDEERQRELQEEAEDRINKFFN